MPRHRRALSIENLESVSNGKPLRHSRFTFHSYRRETRHPPPVPFPFPFRAGMAGGMETRSTQSGEERRDFYFPPQQAAWSECSTCIHSDHPGQMASMKCGSRRQSSKAAAATGSQSADGRASRRPVIPRNIPPRVRSIAVRLSFSVR